MDQQDIARLETEAADKTNANGDVFFQLGMIYGAGGRTPAERIQAHKWFNLAVAKGNREASRLRQELAAEMSRDELDEALRAARQWIVAH